MDIRVIRRLTDQATDRRGGLVLLRPVAWIWTALYTAAIIDWARQHGRYGYRRVTALLRAEGWHCNHKRVERIWRREGLRVPARQPKRGRLWGRLSSTFRNLGCVAESVREPLQKGTGDFDSACARAGRG